MHSRYTPLILATAAWLTLTFAALAGSGPALADVGRQATIPVLDDPLAAYGKRAEYTVYRDGKKVGKHALTFSRKGETLTVQVQSALTVRVLRIPVYRFGYEATETWQNGKLQRAMSKVDENGRKRRLSMRSSGDRSVLESKRGSQQVPRLEYASNHWQPAALGADRVFNTLNGRASNVSVEALGRAGFRTLQGKIDTRRYRYTGGVKATVWYDDEGRWVGLEFSADDDSKIVYRADFR